MRRVGGIRWILIAWLFLLSAIAYLDRVNMSIAGQMLEREYGLTHVQLGSLSSALLLGYALFQAPGGRIADRLGARWTLAMAVVWWGALSAATALVPASALALSLLLLIRFTLGAGEAVMYPASNRVVAQWIPVAERGLANGIIFMGVGVGAGVTPPLVTGIMLRYGWRASFIACALIGLVAGAGWLLTARDSPTEHRWVTEEERTRIRAGISARMSASPLPWRAIWRDRRVALLTGSYFCYGYAAWVFFAWFYIYLNTARGMDLRASARYGMLPFVGMAIGSALGGLLNDRISLRAGRRVGRCGVAAIGMGLAAVFVALGSQVEGAELASVVLAGGAGTLYLAQSSFWSVTADIGGNSAGSVSGIMNMGAQLGGVVTASLTPWIAGRFGWSTSFLTASVLCLVGAIAWMAVRPEAEIQASPERARGTGLGVVTEPG